MLELGLDNAFWIAVLQIIAIDIVLGGDNAVVIALACRRLPPEQRNKGIFWGTFGAIALRIALIAFALNLLNVSYMKLVGGVLLLWIGVKLLLPDDGDGELHMDGGSATLMGAIKTIVVADAVMSMDNVIAVAGAAKGSLALVVFGILISVPIIVWGSKLVLKLMDRFPFVITIGAALLGWIAGEMIVADKALTPLLGHPPAWAHYGAAMLGAVAVVSIGKWRARRTMARKPIVRLPVAPGDNSHFSQDE